MPECGEKSMQPLCLMHVAAASTATTALAALLKPRKFSTARRRMHPAADLAGMFYKGDNRFCCKDDDARKVLKPKRTASFRR
jgi:hypothetical protein